MRRLQEIVQAAKRRLLLRTRLLAGARLAVYGAYDIYCDVRIGQWTGGAESPFRSAGAYSTKSTWYWDLHRIFSTADAAIRPDDKLVDVGCGKGRVIHWWLWRRVANPIVGVELTKQVADDAREGLKSFPQVAVLQGDIVDLVSPDWTLYFMFNPFDRNMMQKFAARVKQAAPPEKEVRVIYHRALHADVFLSDPDWQAKPLRAGLLNPVPIYVFTLRK